MAFTHLPTQGLPEIKETQKAVEKKGKKFIMKSMKKSP